MSWSNGSTSNYKFSLDIIYADRTPAGVSIFKFGQSMVNFFQWINPGLPLSASTNHQKFFNWFAIICKVFSCSNFYFLTKIRLTIVEIQINISCQLFLHSIEQGRTTIHSIMARKRFQINYAPYFQRYPHNSVHGFVPAGGHSAPLIS